MFSDRLQIGSVIESVSDLQGEGQAPAGKCAVSYLHIPNGRHDRSDSELALRKEKKKKNAAQREKRGVSAPFNHPLLTVSPSSYQWSSKCCS